MPGRLTLLGGGRRAQNVVKVFLVAGQSNNYYGASLSAGTDDTTSANLFQYAMATGGTGTANTITANATNPLGWKEYSLTTGPNAHISYAVKFFLDYYLVENPTHKVVIVPYAVGGTALGASNAWRPYTGTYATDAVAKVVSAMAAADTYFSTTSTFGGILWHQGEADLEGSTSYSRFQGYFAALLDYFRSSIAGASSVPFVVGGLSNGSYTTSAIEGSPAWAGSNYGSYWRTILSSVANKIPYGAYADSESPTSLATSTIHFSASDQRAMAARYWTAWQAALANADPACTWDAAHDRFDGTSVHVLSNGNRDVAGNGTGAWKHIKATRGRSSGKYYFEISVVARAVSGEMIGGIAGYSARTISYPGDSATDSGDTPNAAGLFDANGQTNTGFTSVNALSGGASTTLAANDVIGIAVDLTTGKAWVAKNNTWYNSGNPAAGTNNWLSWTPSSVGVIFPAVAVYSNTGNKLRLCATSAQQTYSPPSGFSAWATT